MNSVMIENANPFAIAKFLGQTILAVSLSKGQHVSPIYRDQIIVKQPPAIEHLLANQLRHHPTDDFLNFICIQLLMYSRTCVGKYLDDQIKLQKGVSVEMDRLLPKLEKETVADESWDYEPFMKSKERFVTEQRLCIL